MPFDRDKYPNLHRCFVAFPDWDVPVYAREELDQLIAEREQAARLDAAREARKIVQSLLRKVGVVMADFDDLCKRFGVDP